MAALGPVLSCITKEKHLSLLLLAGCSSLGWNPIDGFPIGEVQHYTTLLGSSHH